MRASYARLRVTAMSRVLPGTNGRWLQGSRSEFNRSLRASGHRLRFGALAESELASSSRIRGFVIRNVGRSRRQKSRVAQDSASCGESRRATASCSPQLAIAAIEGGAGRGVSGRDLPPAGWWSASIEPARQGRHRRATVGSTESPQSVPGVVGLLQPVRVSRKCLDDPRRLCVEQTSRGPFAIQGSAPSMARQRHGCL